MRYPVLAKFAREVLPIPMTVVAPEKVFIKGGRDMDRLKRCRRSKVDPLDKVIPKLLCAQNWPRRVRMKVNMASSHCRGSVLMCSS